MKTKSLFSEFITMLFVVLLSIFMFSTAVADASLPAGTISIDEEAFYGDRSLTALVLPDGLKRIESRAFANSALKKINLPDSISFIAEDAFSGCNLNAVGVNENSYAYDYAVRHRWAIELVPEKPVMDYVAVNDTFAYVAWHRAKGATGYIVYYGTSSDISSAKSVTVGNNNAWIIKRLNPKTKYYFWVKGKNSFQTGAASDYLTGTSTSRSNIETVPSVVFLTEGESVDVSVWMYEGSGITYEIWDPDIVSCEWGNNWEGNKTSLKISGKKKGPTYIDLRDNIDKYVEMIQVFVYPPMPKNQITGDISWLLHTKMESINKQLPDKLRYFDEDAYTNDYFLVCLDRFGEIDSIAMLTDAESGIGKYTLYGVYPGMTKEEAAALFKEAGFSQGSGIMGSSNRFYRSSDSKAIEITVVDGLVDLITYQ